MKKVFYVMAMSMLITAVSCSKGAEGTKLVDTKPVDTTPTSFTTADATTAYTAFNRYFYNTSAKLYYSTTRRDGLAAIWTQAIYWDMAMNVYERTKDPPGLFMMI